MKKFAYILMGVGFDPARHTARFETPGSLTTILTVRDFEEAKAAALRLKAEGCGVIELCGAFGEAKAEELIRLCDNAVGIGYVVHRPQQDAAFKAFFG